MGTARFDDGTPENPKLIAAGPIAAWLWFCGVLYCRRAITDGFIPKDVVPRLVIGLPQPYKHAARLVEVRLWHEAVGGYDVHDYLDWNPSKDAIHTYRQKERDRKQSAHARRAETGDSDPPSRTENDTSARRRASRAGAKSESESEYESSYSLDRSAGEKADPNPSAVFASPLDDTGRVVGEAGAWNPHGRPNLGRGTVHDGGEARRHGMHAFCGRVCVPWGLHCEFKQRLGTAEAEARLQAWYPQTLARHEGRDIGDDTFDFWRNEFAAWVGTVTSKPTPVGSRTGDSMDAAKESLRRRLSKLADGEEEPNVRALKG